MTQADLDGGTTLHNTVTASTGQGAGATDNLAIPIVVTPGLVITKTSTSTMFSVVGQSIEYTMTATNTGNVTLTGVTSATRVSRPSRAPPPSLRRWPRVPR